MGGSPGDISEKNEQSSAHSPSFPSLHLRHSSFSNPSIASPTSQLILQSSFRCAFTNLSVTSPTSAHSPILSSLYLRHSSFSNCSVASYMSQLILQSFRCSFSNLSVTSPTPQLILPSLYLSQLILQPFFRFS